MTAGQGKGQGNTRHDDTVPTAIRLMAEPVRWRVMRELARGDHRVRELVASLGLPQNLVSYHLRQLRDGGLVTSRRSNFDARDTYYSLDLPNCARALGTAGARLHPGLALVRPPAASTPAGSFLRPWRVLFVCTGNSGRSPVAAALLGHRAGRRVRAVSAGTHPKPLHPAAAPVLRSRAGIDIGGHQPAHVDTVASVRFDYVVSLCDKAREACPPFAGSPARVHWSLPDPAADAANPAAAEAAFDRLITELDARIEFFLPLLAAIPA